MKEFLLARYPELSYDDVVLRDDGEGIYIDVWNSDTPKPTLENIKQWFEDDNFLLTKTNKYKELDNACESTILGRFKVTIDGLEYEFSNDEKAQSRFNGTGYLFSEGMIMQVEWTTYLQGERTSISLTKEKFDIVALAALNHTNSNIEKFREKINQLNLAQTIEEVNAITW